MLTFRGLASFSKPEDIVDTNINYADSIVFYFFIFVILVLIIYLVSLNKNPKKQNVNPWGEKHILFRILIFFACVIIPLFLLIGMTLLSGQELNAMPRINPWITASLFYGIIKSIYNKSYSHWITGGILTIIISDIVGLIIINKLLKENDITSYLTFIQNAELMKTSLFVWVVLLSTILIYRAINRE